MTAEELTLNQYPTLKDQPQWTNHREHNNDQHYEYLAMDCEMVHLAYA
jgi:hypothetical protein